MFHDKFKS